MGSRPARASPPLLVGVGMLTLATIRLGIAVTPLWVLTPDRLPAGGVDHLLCDLHHLFPGVLRARRGRGDRWHGPRPVQHEGLSPGESAALWQGLCTVVPVGAVAYLPAGLCWARAAWRARWRW